ncbi:SRPBCC domain-containing protein [uncultured Imperialibacter sp.]|uniref:SRPBCC family protein n=1 Tax=uncultured Imperialibacter sp. TaxID=1672639 RepID=UPI0030D977F1
MPYQNIQPVIAASPSITRSIHIDAPPSKVWGTLTVPDLMKEWMAEPEMELGILTTWKVGSAMVVKGFHHVKFENKGTVLAFEPNKLLSYNYLSSISRLPDEPENYTVIEFTLAATEAGTTLAITLSNFPTDSIFKHVDFYWAGTIEIIKSVANKEAKGPSGTH